MPTTRIYFAVVPSRGCYGSGERVRALSVHRDAAVAIRKARAATASYRKAMSACGGSSGGYRVVTCGESRASDTSWIGSSLDRIPSYEPTVFARE